MPSSPGPSCKIFVIILFVLATSVSLVNCRMPENRNTKGDFPEKGNSPAPSNSVTNDPSVIHRNAIAIDMHADTAQRLVDEGVDLNRRLSDGHLDAIRMKEGGLDAQFFSIWVEPALYGSVGSNAVERADKQIEAVRNLAVKHPETWELAGSATDIRRISLTGKLSALMGLEGGYAIDEKLENVEKYYKLGVRYMSPAWSVSTSWAGSSGDVEGQNRGLNDFGKKVIAEMNRLGMLVDVSHVSDKTFWDIVSTSTKPVIATHSNCRAIANVKRNLTDDMIKAIAKSGGVVSVVFYSEFVEPGWSEKKKVVDEQIAPLVQKANDAVQGSAAQKKIARDKVRMVEYAKRLPPVPLSHLVDHIDHIVKLVGIDYVGIGSDYDGIQATVEGLGDVSQLPNLTAELLRRGYSASDVEKILGGNILRAMEKTESAGM
jgi:membrane dipeptidase